ncbi:O-antigen ligase family protein [Pseudoalteromonas sp. SiA1]|uniref:O-antigen ligase family protein n=1 Tax=Pseudoalteromonas sp. SiA1 TaxID=2839744 RepID=UPI001C000A65|nr:O-antigen ligase family protein [Pseudoalteromonas sp. SiA1]QWF33922.1 O-antigen ligase family protein [Pseudoalteromonas sp. SiA1]
MLKISKQMTEKVLLFICLMGILFNILFGTIAALSFLIGGVLFCLCYENKLLDLLINNKLLLAIPLLAIISSIWSDIPLTTLRGGIQLLLTTLFAMVIAAVVRFESFIKISGICFFITMFLCFVSDRYVINGLTGEHNLIGIFNSKNFLSMNAAFSFFVGCTIYRNDNFTKKVKLFGLALIILSFSVLLKTKSLGSIVTAVLVLMLSLLYIFYQKIKLLKLIRSQLNWFIILSFLMLVFGLIVIGNTSTFDNVMYDLGKDPTLTGRTFIWSRGLESVTENPIFGLGFQSAFYVGNPLAEEIWEFAHVPSGAGFNFHNMYIDITVEMGLLGGFIFILLLGKFIRLLANNKKLEFGSKEGFALMVFLYMFLQTFLEAGWFSQFTISHFLICAAWIYLKQTTELKSIKLRWNV